MLRPPRRGLGMGWERKSEKSFRGYVREFWRPFVMGDVSRVESFGWLMKGWPLASR